jgi:lipopolysaccharide transport system permease protein
MTLRIDYLSAFLRHQTLFAQLVRREVVGRYRGSLLGVFWAFATPLLMLGVYTFVFVGIFSMRWPGAEAAGGTAYALRLFAGLVVFNFFSEVISRSPSQVLEQPNLVKRVVFPLELLAHVSLSVATVHLLISFVILLVASALTTGISWSVLLVPVVLLPLAPLTLGLCWLLSALGVYVRDLAQFIGLAVSLLLFLSPIFYSAERLPESIRPWMVLNPLALPIENLRRCVFSGGVGVDWLAWGVSLFVSLVIAWLGAVVFARLRRGFSDVI